MIQSINPFTGETIAEYLPMTTSQVGEIIDAADQAFADWHRTTFAERSVCLRRAGQILRENSDEYARLMASEMGKVIGEGRAEAKKCAWVCDYYAEHAEEFLRREIIASDAGKSFVTFAPLGAVLAIMPWNFPLWQVFRFAAPALMAGNVAVLKHASNVPGCSLAIEKILHQAGVPASVFRSLLIGSDQVAAIIANPKIQAVTLTGSTHAGKAVARYAGAALKKSVLELGGSDPYLVLADADLEATVETCVTSRLINAGQSCIAAKRFIVVQAVLHDFEKLFIEKMAARKTGDPLDETTQLGPQARHDLRDELHRQVTASIAAGASCLLGGQIPSGRGAIYPATVLTNVRKGMPAYDEELFGPVAAIIAVADEREAIAVANDSDFGLGAAVFTQDKEKGERIAAEELAAGCCFVNSFVKSDPRLPFGGIKQSGYGRELSHYGIKEFVNIKTVVVG